MEKEEDISSVLNEQREELMAAKTLESDLDFAFNLQIQEAINASLKNNTIIHHSNASTSQQQELIYTTENDAVTLLLEDLDRYDQEWHDHSQCEAEMKIIRQDLNRRIHDQKMASEIKNIPEDEWENYGDNYDRPYNDKDENLSSESWRLYIKGVVSEERIRDMRVVVAAIGVAICDPKDNLMFEMKKGLEDGYMVSGERAELEALVEGLDVALGLNLDRVCFFVDDYLVYQYVTQRLPPKHSKIATLVNQVAILQQKFKDCRPSFVAPNDIKFAFKLAKDAIVSQIVWPVETKGGKSLKETCVICFEDIDVAQMFSVDGCLHRYCFSCMKQHVEVKVLNGMVAKCPHEGCKSDIGIDSCGKFLDPKLVEIMSNRMKETSIAVTEKIYCPYPRCSALMSKHEVLEYTNSEFVVAQTSGARKCMKCNRYFCINCKVPWHHSMTCQDYKRNPQSNPDDAQVKSLAQKKRWRQCVKCNHYVELAEGCYHITCRCTYEFCYTCGAEWKNKKATCTCPIWDERNIIRDDRQGQRR